MNHLAYADDIVIFTGGKSKSVKLVLKQIKLYEKSSGQKLNRDKSFFLTSPKTSPSRINRMREITGFMDHNFPFTYLGCPIYIGRKKIAYFDGLVSKIVKRLSGWQGKILSLGVNLLLSSMCSKLSLHTLLLPFVLPRGLLILLKSTLRGSFGDLTVKIISIIGALRKISVKRKKMVVLVLKTGRYG